MIKDLKTLYANLLPYRDMMVSELSLTEVGNGLLLKIGEINISDMPNTIIVGGSTLRLTWDAMELNISHDDRGEVEYSGLSIYTNDTFIGEILL